MSLLNHDPIAHACHNIVGMERERQVTMGYTPAHDRDHGAADFQEMINRREHDVFHHLEEGDAQAALQKYAQIAALAEAAMYQIIARNPEVLNG